MTPLELRCWLALTRRLPPWPKMLGLANHVARRIYLRKPRAPVEVTVHGARMRLDPTELTEGLLLFAPHLLDSAELAALRDALRPGDTFLDLGAHVGLYTLIAARCVAPGGRVLAVEPEPESRARLRDHLACNALEGVEVIADAVSDRDEVRPLRRGPHGNRGASGLLRVDGATTPVRCRPVADLLAERGIHGVDVAKLDLEGMEHRVLEAWLTPCPGPARPRLLIVEHHAGAPDDTVALLRTLGYRVRRVGRHNLVATREDA